MGSVLNRLRLAVAAISLALTAAAPPAQPVPPTSAALVAGPEAAARELAASGAPRLIYFFGVGGNGTPGITCSIPSLFLTTIGIGYEISDVPVGPPTYDYRDVGRFNLTMITLPDSPFGPFCRPAVAGDWSPSEQGGGPVSIAPWSHIGPAPLPVFANAGDGMTRDIFGLSPLAWAAILGDHARIRKIISASPDRTEWCAAPADNLAQAIDPLTLAAKRSDAVASKLIASYFAPRFCSGEPADYHRLYEAAFDAALAQPDYAVAAGLIPGFSQVEMPQVADRLDRGGYIALAARADARVTPGTQSLLAVRAKECSWSGFERWRKSTLARPGGRAALDAAWRETLRGGSWQTASAAHDCTTLFESLVAAGYRLPPQSKLLYSVIAEDRAREEDKLSIIEAKRIVAAVLAAGGDLTTSYEVPGRPRCTALDVATAADDGPCLLPRPGHRGLTAFSIILRDRDAAGGSALPHRDDVADDTR